MTIQITRWSPDTCGCQIDYQWDDTVPQDERVHTVSNIVKACPIHAGQLSKESHYAEVVNENQSKNKAIGLILQRHPNLKDKDGNFEHISYRFLPDRSIVVTLPESVKNDIIDINLAGRNAFPKKVVFE